MNAENVADLVEGVARGLGDGLKASAAQELTALAGLLRRYGGRPVKEFVAFVEKAFAGDRDSVPALVERIQSARAGGGEPAADLQAVLKKLTVAPLKSVAKALGVPAGRTKADTLAALQSFIAGGPAAGPGAGGGRDPGAADRGYREYEAIQRDLSGLSIEEIRVRFRPILELAKPDLEEIARRLGYTSVGGSREEIARQLLSVLERKKTSQVQTSFIGGGGS
jgi:hypothetical protein